MGENVSKRESIGFSDMESSSQKRIDLLSIIKNKSLKSIYELAKITNREYKSVYDDVEVLEE